MEYGKYELQVSSKCSTVEIDGSRITRAMKIASCVFLHARNGASRLLFAILRPWHLAFFLLKYDFEIYLSKKTSFF